MGIPPPGAAVSRTDPDFSFVGVATPARELPAYAMAAEVDPLGPLGDLTGSWRGHGFNSIWRPHHPVSSQGHFLELSLTDETLVFSKINGAIPNRGLATPDIMMFGLTYMQQISEATTGVGLHIESGAWLRVPATSNPNEPPSIVRMACIPHGSVVLAQGLAQVEVGGPQHIPDNNILPFFVHSPAPVNTEFGSVAATFPELDLSRLTAFRSATAGVTQAMVENPNGILRKALQASLRGTKMESRTSLHVTTTGSLIRGAGGTANTAFLQGATNPPGGNATTMEVEATFWIERIAGTAGRPDTHQLQYTQRVHLDFNGIRWPHVNVATLRKA